MMWRREGDNLRTQRAKRKYERQKEKDGNHQYHRRNPETLVGGQPGAVECRILLQLILPSAVRVLSICRFSLHQALLTIAGGCQTSRFFAGSKSRSPNRGTANSLGASAFK